MCKVRKQEERSEQDAQIKAESEGGESVKEVCKNCRLYNDGWCEAFVVQKLPNTKGCFGFIPNEEEDT